MLSFGPSRIAVFFTNQGEVVMGVLLPKIPEDFVLSLPQLDTDDIRILWHCDFYDGPRDGVINYQERPYWFAIQEDAEVFRSTVDGDGQRWSEWYTRFVVIAITDNQFTELRS